MHIFLLQPGYERLCCLRCIQTADSNFQTTCICRVPKSQLPPGQVVECVNCGKLLRQIMHFCFQSDFQHSNRVLTGVRVVVLGCRGCASCDGNMDPFDDE